MAGILLAVAGVGWVVTEKQPGKTVVENKQYKAGIFFGLLGALGQVANLVTARYGLVGGYPSISATIIRILVAVVVMWSYALLRGKVQVHVQQMARPQSVSGDGGRRVCGAVSGHLVVADCHPVDAIGHCFDVDGFAAGFVDSD